jgi:hypothetical protein
MESARFAVRGVESGLYQSRSDRIHADPFRCDFAGRGDGEAVDCAF